MEDDTAAWEGWDVESNSSDDSGDSGSWHDVESDGDEAFDVSDSNDESLEKTNKGKGKAIRQKGGEVKEDVEMKDEAPRVSTLATTKVSLRSKTPEYVMTSGFRFSLLPTLPCYRNFGSKPHGEPSKEAADRAPNARSRCSKHKRKPLLFQLLTTKTLLRLSSLSPRSLVCKRRKKPTMKSGWRRSRKDEKAGRSLGATRGRRGRLRRAVRQTVKSGGINR